MILLAWNLQKADKQWMSLNVVSRHVGTIGGSLVKRDLSEMDSSWEI